jgi:hypothetical protein
MRNEMHHKFGRTRRCRSELIVQTLLVITQSSRPFQSHSSECGIGLESINVGI